MLIWRGSWHSGGSGRKVFGLAQEPSGKRASMSLAHKSIGLGHRLIKAHPDSKGSEFDAGEEGIGRFVVARGYGNSLSVVGNWPYAAESPPAQFVQGLCRSVGQSRRRGERRQDTLARRKGGRAPRHFGSARALHARFAIVWRIMDPANASDPVFRHLHRLVPGARS